MVDVVRCRVLSAFVRVGALGGRREALEGEGGDDGDEGDGEDGGGGDGVVDFITEGNKDD